MAKWKKIRDRQSNGKKTGVVVQKQGSNKQVSLLNPHGKFCKATEELKQGVHLTNEGAVKVDSKTGNAIPLSTEDRKFREGYRAAMIDAAKAHNAQTGKKNNGLGGAF